MAIQPLPSATDFAMSIGDAYATDGAAIELGLGVHAGAIAPEAGVRVSPGRGLQEVTDRVRAAAGGLGRLLLPLARVWTARRRRGLLESRREHLTGALTIQRELARDLFGLLKRKV